MMEEVQEKEIQYRKIYAKFASVRKSILKLSGFGDTKLRTSLT